MESAVQHRALSEETSSGPNQHSAIVIVSQDCGSSVLCDVPCCSITESNTVLCKWKEIRENGQKQENEEDIINFMNLPVVTLWEICRRLHWRDVDSLRCAHSYLRSLIDSRRHRLPRRSVRVEISAVRNTENLYLMVLTWKTSNKRVILAERTTEPTICMDQGIEDIFTSGTDTVYLVVGAVTHFLEVFMPQLLWRCCLRRISMRRVTVSLLSWFAGFCVSQRITVSDVRLFPIDITLNEIQKFLQATRPSRLLLELKDAFYLEELLSDTIVSNCTHLYLDINDHADAVFNLKSTTLPSIRARSLEIMQKVVIGEECLRGILQQWVNAERSFDEEWTFIIQKDVLNEETVFRNFKHVRISIASPDGTRDAYYTEIYRKINGAETKLNVFWKNYVLLLNASEKRIESVLRICR